MLGRATGIGIVLPDGQGTLMMEQSVQNVGGLATALLKRVEEQQPNLRCSSLPMTSAATERNSKVISSDPPITSGVIVNVTLVPVLLPKALKPAGSDENETSK